MAVIYGAVIFVVATQISDVSIYVTGIFGTRKVARTKYAAVDSAFLLVVAVLVDLAFRRLAAPHNRHHAQRADK
jgi:hypothetical protein